MMAIEMKLISNAVYAIRSARKKLTKSHNGKRRRLLVVNSPLRLWFKKKNDDDERAEDCVLLYLCLQSVHTNSFVTLFFSKLYFTINIRNITYIIIYYYTYLMILDIVARFIILNIITYWYIILYEYIFIYLLLRRHPETVWRKCFFFFLFFFMYEMIRCIMYYSFFFYVLRTKCRVFFLLYAYFQL